MYVVAAPRTMAYRSIDCPRTETTPVIASITAANRLLWIVKKLKKLTTDAWRST
jgi:hypothetical protein